MHYSTSGRGIATLATTPKKRKKKYSFTLGDSGWVGELVIARVRVVVAGGAKLFLQSSSILTYLLIL